MSTTQPPTIVKKALSIIVIASNRLQDEVMHVCDLFEPWKTLIDAPLEIEATSPEAINNVPKTLSELRTALDQRPTSYRVIAIFVPDVSDGAWCDRSVVAVSDGTKWSKFADLLRRLKFQGEMPPLFPSLGAQPGTIEAAS